MIIDNYNYERFVAEAIESALGQTHPDTEVIVVDDGSTDSSREVVGRYGDKVRTVFKENGGQGSALNAGFAASEGQVVLFLDADDLLMPGAIEQVLPHFADPEVVKVHWSVPIIDAGGRRTGEVAEPELAGGDFREDVLREGPQSDAAPLSAPNSGNAWSRAFLKRVMPMPEEANVYGADTYLFALAPAYGRIVVLEEPQSLYRIHGENYHGTKSFAEVLELAKLDLEILPPIAARPYQEAGLEVDFDEWRRRSWWGRVARGVEEILELVAQGQTFLLADQESWGADEDFFGRRRVPFPESEGEYGGVPEGDADAIAEVQRWRGQGAVAIFFAWPAFWWLEEFEQLARHLERHYRCVCRDEVLIGFGLQA